MREPAPLTRNDLDRPRQGVEAHDHAVCTYETQDELLAALRAFVNEGLAKGDLVVFVHSFGSDDEAWQFIKRAAPAVKDEPVESVIVVSLYEAAFEGGARRIDYEHVGRVVESLDQRARDAGKQGTRIFVDASRTYFAGARAAEWFAFENWLGVRLQARIGLVCAYQRADIMKEDVLPQVLRTHAYRFDAPRS